MSNDAHGKQQLSYTAQGFLIPDQGDKHLQKERLGCREVSDLLEHPASQGQSQQVGIWLWAPTCQELPSGSWIRSLRPLQAMGTPFNPLRNTSFYLDHLQKRPFSVKSGSTTLHSMALK